MAGKDTKLAFSKTIMQDNRWMAGKSSSGASEPAPDTFLNPPSKRHPLGNRKLRTLRKRIYTLGKLIDRRDRAVQYSCPIPEYTFMKVPRWAWMSEEEWEEKRGDSISINACRRQIRHWERCSRKKPAGAGRGGPKSLLRKEIDKWLLLEIDERPLWRIYKALLAEHDCGASQPVASSGLVEDIQKIGRLEFDSAGREIDLGRR